MNKIVKKSLPKQIAEIIEEKIKNDEYRVGDKLPTEPELVQFFGASRNTVREAIQSLTQSGLLETRQGDGTYVIAKERLQVEFFNIMNAATSQNVMEVRSMMEKHIVLSAIKNAEEEDIEDIAHHLALRKEVKSLRETSQADLDFHIAIAKATHNDILVNLYRYISEYIVEYIYEKFYQQKKDPGYIDEIHDLLYLAIREKNNALALDCVNKIIEI